MKWLILGILLFQSIDLEIIEKKSLEAREILKKEILNFRRAKKNTSSWIVVREIALAVYSPSRDAIGIVKIEVDVTSGKKFRFKVLTPNYHVERITGLGITRLQFNVVGQDNEKLIILDSRHLHLEDKKISPRDLFYFLYSDIFQHEYFTNKGLQFYKHITQKSKSELCTTGAKSRAYPEKLLCEVFPDHFFLTLGAIEQMDDGEFFADPEYSVKKFLAHILRNGENAFFYSVSQDGARGLMQFMNSRRYPTYNQTRKNYPEVGLLSDFELATADIKNSIKAAICLADTNLSKLPENSRKKFLEDQFRGGEAVAAAHNGGLGRALNFLRDRKIPKETKNFLKKYRETWKILEKFKKNFEQGQR